MTVNRNLESNQIDICRAFTSLWKTDPELRLQIKSRIEKLRRLLLKDPDLPANESVQATLLALNTFLIAVKTVLETVYPGYSSEEWLELEDDFNENMRRGDRSAAIVQIFRQLAETVFALAEPDRSKHSREINQSWEMVKLCYRRQPASGL